MRLSDINPLPNYFSRYMELAGNIHHMEALQYLTADIDVAPVKQWELLGDHVYLPGKWTIKTIIQHIIDTERVFIYRALAYARGEKEKVLGFDENEYANQAPVADRTIQDLLHELNHTHESARLLFASLPDELLQNTCQGFAGEYIVGAVPFILLGHQRWHFSIIEERYLPILKS